MSFTASYSMAGAGTLFALFWLFVYFKYMHSFKDVIDAIDKKKYMLGELYFIGFGIIKLFRINIKNKKGRKKIKEIGEIYGDKYAEFYYYIVTGGGITYFATILPLGFFIGAIANDTIVCLLGVLASLLLMFYLYSDIDKNVSGRREDILNSLPQALSKFTLLINAGLIVREAWQKTAYTNSGPLYEEMQNACIEMDNGVSVRQAINHFAERCAVKEVRKFANSVNQNMEKGGGELSKTLKELTTVSWEEKRSRVKIKAAGVGTKLMFPSMIIFVGIILMVVVPMFANLSF